MTTTTAALILAWIAILMLTLATAGLLRRVNQLSASRMAPQATEPGESVKGLQIPMAKYLSDFDGGGTDVLLLFISPSCATCQTAIGTLADAAEMDHRIGFRIGLVMRGADAGPLDMPDGWTRLTSASSLFQVLRVPATPYLVRLGPDGTIIDSTMVVGDLSLGQWLAHRSPVTSTV